MRYLLDTNIVIAVLNRRSEAAARRLAMARQDCSVSTVVVHELAFGAYKSNDHLTNLRKRHALGLAVLDFAEADAIAAGQVRAVLGRAGTPIGPYDFLIAGQALSRGLVLVTNNTREFARVSGLRLEDWTVA